MTFEYGDQYGAQHHPIRNGEAISVNPIGEAISVNPIGRMWAFGCDLDLGERRTIDAGIDSCDAKERPRAGAVKVPLVEDDQGAASI